jgi:putative SOS response-associated peptidase YedK
MCGRFYIPEDDSPEDLAALLREADERAGEPLPRGEITPGMQAPVVCMSRAGNPRVFPMHWGYPVAERLLVNARSETASIRTIFQESYRSRRCLIPAAAWFEWDHRVKPMTKYRISRGSQPWFYLAGLYRLTEDGPQYTVLTREAIGGLHDLHHRMPVTFAAADAASWLDPDADPDAMVKREPGPVAWMPVPGQAEQVSLWEV